MKSALVNTFVNLSLWL